MRTVFNKVLGITAIVIGLAFAGTASAIPISTVYNFVPFGTLTANDPDVGNATFVTSGAPDIVTTIITDNTGLVSGVTVITLTSPTPTSLAAAFTKTWTTALGTFTESLVVTIVNRAFHSLGITAVGIITSTNALFDPTPVFYSAAYTQNAQGQINGSFNNSTVPPGQAPEPATLALLGLGLAGLGLFRRRKQ